MHRTPQRIQIKSKDEIQKMRAAGRVVHAVHERCRAMARPGVTTRQIDEAGDEVIRAHGGEGLFKGYVVDPRIPPFPSHLCTSVNEVVVHGIANDEPLQAGDVVGIDCGVRLNGWCGDAANTIVIADEGTPAGQEESILPDDVRMLLATTRECLEIAISEIRPGRKWSQIARLMEKHARNRGLGVVENFVGHGIGSEMHEPPQVPNFVSRELLRKDILLSEGLVLAIEPMCNLGTKEVEVLKDGWTVVTRDRLPSAHFEHTVAVTATGSEVLTNGE